jgi:predicted DNA binding protein
MLKQVVFSLTGTGFLKDLSAKYSCAVSMIDCRNTGAHSMSMLVEIKGEQDQELIRELRQLKEVKRVYATRSGPHKTLVMMVLDTLPHCEAARDSGAFCITCPLNPAKDDGWKLLVNDANGVRKISESLAEEGLEAEVLEVSNAFHDELLTERQKQIMNVAYYSGYFEFPRKKDLTKLAEDMSIRPSTLSEILRRAESKIVKHYMQSIRSS